MSVTVISPDGSTQEVGKMTFGDEEAIRPEYFDNFVAREERKNGNGKQKQKVWGLLPIEGEAAHVVIELIEVGQKFAQASIVSIIDDPRKLGPDVGDKVYIHGDKSYKLLLDGYNDPWGAGSQLPALVGTYRRGGKDGPQREDFPWTALAIYTDLRDRELQPYFRHVAGKTAAEKNEDRADTVSNMLFAEATELKAKFLALPATLRDSDGVDAVKCRNAIAMIRSSAMSVREDPSKGPLAQHTIRSSIGELKASVVALESPVKLGSSIGDKFADF